VVVADRCAHEIALFLERDTMRLRRLNAIPLGGYVNLNVNTFIFCLIYLS